MKSFKIIFFCTCLMISTLWAKQPDFSIYGQLGFGLLVSKGDMNDRVLSVKDEDGTKGNLHPATLQVLGSPDLSVGVNIKSFSLALDFQYWTSAQNLTGYPDEALERDTRIMRLGAEFTYNVFWPEFFQAGIGGGISYINVKTDDNLFYGAQTYDVTFSGLALGLIANIRYYITDQLAMVPAIKFYENCFFDADSKWLENDSMNSHLWQTMVLVSLTVQYQF